MTDRKARAKTTAGPSAPLRFAQDDNSVWMTDRKARAKAKATAGPSTSLRFAQDDKRFCSADAGAKAPIDSIDLFRHD
jgi:hypothetical protein